MLDIIMIAARQSTVQTVSYHAQRREPELQRFDDSTTILDLKHYPQFSFEIYLLISLL